MYQARDIIRALFPVATLVTPNIPEAAAILKMIGEDSIASHIESVEGMEQAAKAIYALGPAYVLVKGGHLAPSNSTGQQVHFRCIGTSV
jgi:hydroxymethylpyrimidine/phosphomethylpyrimidine kinase